MNDFISDEELVSQIASSSDSQSFAILYDRYSNTVYNKCLSFVKSKEEAQDITHDIFIKLYFKLSSFKGNAKFSTWLYSFTYNFCVNHVQRVVNKKSEAIHPLADQTTLADIEEIEDSTILEMKADILMKALDLMDVNDKMILLMKYQDEMSIKDIIDILEIGESAAKMRLNRAKAKLTTIYKSLN